MLPLLPKDVADEAEMSLAWEAVELPEKDQTVVLLVSPWRGLMVRINCA